MKDMFKGLVEINNYNISHLDIKPDNIVISKDNFKFIDFGLSNKINKIDYFKKRSYNEFKTSRIYLYYPLEYIYSFLTPQIFAFINLTIFFYKFN